MSIGPAFDAHVPPSRGTGRLSGLQAEQVVSRMEVVLDNLLYSGVAMRGGDVIQMGSRTANYLFS